MQTKIITWPFVQDLFDIPGFRDNSALCVSDEYYGQYGDSAYAVSEDWLDTLTDRRAIRSAARGTAGSGPDTDFDSLESEDGLKSI